MSLDATKVLTSAAEIDPAIPLPLYYQLKQVLLSKIRNGDIAPGEVILSEKELEKRYRVSRITVRRALSELAAEGLISRQSGRGTFVLPPKAQDRSMTLGGFVEDLIGQGYKVQSQIRHYETRPAPHTVAQKLGTAQGCPLMYFEKLIQADTEPIAIAYCYFNLSPSVVLSLEELNAFSIYPLLERKYGISLRCANRTIEATVASEDEAHLLHVKPNAPLLLAELIVYDDQGQSTAFVKTLYRGDRYKYCSRVSR